MKTKELTKTALLSALIALFALTFIYLPVFSVAGLFFGVCAVVVLTVSVDSLKAISVGLVVSLVLTAILSDILTALYNELLMILLPGLALGLCFRKKLQMSHILLIGSLAYLAATVASFALMKVLSGVDLVAELKTTIEQGMNWTVSVLNSMPELANTAQGEELIKSIPGMSEAVILLLPATLMMLAGGLTLAGTMLSRSVLCKMGQSFSYLQSFSRLLVPKQFAYAYVVLLLASLFVNPSSSVYFLLLNATTVLSAILFVDGMSLLKALINKTGVPGGISLFLFWIVAIFLILLFQFVAYAGVADALFDFRKLRPKKQL